MYFAVVLTAVSNNNHKIFKGKIDPQSKNSEVLSDFIGFHLTEYT